MRIGDYVRTKNGNIFKYVKYDEQEKQYWRTFSSDNSSITTAFKIENVIESSQNIIDLIDIGDYINGSKLLSIDYAEDEYGNCDKLHFYYSFEDDEKDVNEYYEELKIKSIVTKEQFESMEYKIEE